MTQDNEAIKEARKLSQTTLEQYNDGLISITELHDTLEFNYGIVRYDYASRDIKAWMQLATWEV